LETGKNEAALAELKALYDVNRKDRDARTHLVSAYLRLGRAADAKSVLADALKRNSKDTDALLQRSEIHLLEGKYDEAQADVAGVLRFRPDSPEAHMLMARVYRARGADESARQELAESVRLNPKFLPARIELAHAYTLANQPQAAIDLLDASSPEDQKTLAVITERNAALYAMGDNTAMQAGVDKGLAIARTPELLLQDGLLKLRLGDLKAGRAPLEDVLKQKPQEWRALEALALSYAAEKKIPEATKLVREHAAKMPQSPTAQQFLATWLMRTGDADGARAAYQNARSLSTDPTLIDFQLAELDLREGKLDSARTGLLALLARQPGNLALLLDLGQTEFRAGHTPQAVSYYEQAVEKAPKNIQALNNLAYLLADTGKDPDRALALAQQVKELAPNDMTIDDTIGWAYYKKGLFQSAVEYLSLNKGATARSKCHLAMAYIKIGSRARAQELLGAAVKEDPSLPEVRNVLALLASPSR